MTSRPVHGTTVGGRICDRRVVGSTAGLGTVA